MPTYEYKCQKCGYRFDHFQSISSEPLKVCPKCGGELHRLFGEGSGVLFKGSGFYCTDYHSHNNVATESHSKSAPSTEKK